MGNPALTCAECGTLLYIPGIIATAVDVEKAIRLTAEQKYNLGITCSSNTCPSRCVIPGSCGILEGAQMEQAGDVRNVESISGQQPQLSNNEIQQQQQQQQEDEDLDKTLQVELELYLNDPLHEVDCKPVHRGQNPCRACYQRGMACRRHPGSDSCIACQGRCICHRSLAGAKPSGFWAKLTVLDYTAPLSIDASRTRHVCKGGDVVEYHVKYAGKTGKAKWVAAENLKEYPWVLKKFHHDMPDMPGPAEWLAKEDGDEFFYGSSDHLSM